MITFAIIAAYLAVALWTCRRVALEMAAKTVQPSPFFGITPAPRPEYDPSECFGAGVGAGIFWPLYYIGRALWSWIFKPVTDRINLTKEN